MDRRKRAWRELTAGDGGDAPGKSRPAAEVIDGEVFPYKDEPRCRVCGSTSGATSLTNAEKVRVMIDELLVAGATYKRILATIEPFVEDWPANRRPGYHSIRRHQLRHLPVDDAAVREIVERRAREQGLRIVVGDGPIITRAAVLELVRDRGLAALLSGETKPTMAETLHAAEVLEEIDREAGSQVTVGELAGQVRTFVEVVRSRVPEQIWTEIVQAVGEQATAGALPGPTDQEGQDDA